MTVMCHIMPYSYAYDVCHILLYCMFMVSCFKSFDDIRHGIQSLLCCHMVSVSDLLCHISYHTILLLMYSIYYYIICIWCHTLGHMMTYVVVYSV